MRTDARRFDALLPKAVGRSPRCAQSFSLFEASSQAILRDRFSLGNRNIVTIKGTII